MTYLEKTFWPNDMAVFYPFSIQLPVMAGLGLHHSDYSYQRCRYCNGKTFAVSVYWMDVVRDNYSAGYRNHSGSLAAPFSMADRYHYLPLIGIAVMLAWGIPLLIKREDIRKKILFPAAIAALAIWQFLTWQQCGYWKNSIDAF